MPGSWVQAASAAAAHGRAAGGLCMSQWCGGGRGTVLSWYCIGGTRPEQGAAGARGGGLSKEQPNRVDFLTADSL